MIRTIPQLTVVAGLALAAAFPARAQVTFAPNPTESGGVVTLSSDGLFGAGPGVVSLVNARLSIRLTPEVVRWGAGTITVKLLPNTPNGCYDVRVRLGDSGQLSASECLTVVLRPSLRAALAEDPCAQRVTLRLTGRGFSPGTEVRDQPDPSGGRIREPGRTSVEPVSSNRAASEIYARTMTFHIRSSTVIEAQISKCFVLDSGASMWVWFPSGNHLRRTVGSANALPTPKPAEENPPEVLISVEAPQVCRDTLRFRFTGTLFSPGTEVAPHPGRPASRTWCPGLTVVETASQFVPSGPGPQEEDPAEAYGQRMTARIKSANLIEGEVDLCFPLHNGAKVRLWFPDGSRSDWVPFEVEAPSIRLYFRSMPENS